MRLLLVSSEFPPGPGGIGTHAHQLCVNLARLGWDIRVVTPQDYAEPAEIEAFNRAQPFSVAWLPSGRGLFRETAERWRTVSAHIRRWRPDVILATGDRMVYLAGVLGRRHRLPWVAVEHGRIPARWELALKRRYFSRATALISVSNYSHGRLIDMGVRPRHAEVIPNGADASQFEVLPHEDTLQVRAELGLVDAKLLITVGNVSARKGQDVVIRAMPAILREAPDTHYLCIGLPSKREEFAALADALGVADHVHFLGSVSPRRLVQLLNSADIFLMTSRHTVDQWEGYGIAVVEAALCRKPAVVSAQSGLAEAIVDGVTGIGVPEEDDQATARAVLSLLKDDALRARMGHAARERAASEQTWEYRVKEYDAVLRKVCESGTGRLVDVTASTQRV